MESGAGGEGGNEVPAPLVTGGSEVRDPEELESQGAPAQGKISPRTTPGPVHLTVSDLQRSLAYYVDSVGLERLGGGDGRASLGVAGRELLVLIEEPGARPSVGHTGLYHFALLVPSRADLARWLAHAARERIPLVGLSDHFVSEAIYLADPDRHGIEIYWDRPRQVWEGKVAERLTTLPLDVSDLLAELSDPASASFDGLPAATIMGHVHFKVAEIPETVTFYRDVLGFDLMAELDGSAAFLGAGGYHHHVGVNTWESAGAPAPAPGVAALRTATFVFPDDGARDRVLERVRSAGAAIAQDAGQHVVRDPSGIALAFTVS
jgi:catechol 2,3-dioxygenase